MTDKKQRFVKLGWEILEHKCRYYMHSAPSISDYDYDMLEKEYEALGSELGLEPSASDMVDFDENRPACQNVVKKIELEKMNPARRRKWLNQTYGDFDE